MESTKYTILLKKYRKRQYNCRRKKLKIKTSVNKLKSFQINPALSYHFKIEAQAKENCLAV